MTYVEFDGVDDYLTMDSPQTSGDDFVFEIDLAADEWNPSSGEQQLFDDLNAGETAGLRVILDNIGGLEVTIGDGSTGPVNLTTDPGLIDGTRHTLRLVWDGSAQVLDLYVDDVFETDETLWGSVTSIGANDETSCYVAAEDGTSKYFAGKIYSMSYSIDSTTVVDVDFSDYTEGATSGAATVGGTFTLTGTSVTSVAVPPADITRTVKVSLGGTLTDVTDKIDGFVTSYGRRKEFEAFPAGSCSFTIEDRTGDYVPNGGGTYSGETWIGREVQVFVTTGLEQLIWCGTIEDVDIQVNGFFEARIGVSAVGPLAELGRTQIASGETFSSELSSARVSNVLNLAEVSYGRSADIQTGEATLQSDSDAGGNALQYLNLVADSEGGLLFVRKGTLTFRSRSATSSDVGVTFTDEEAGTSFALYDGGDASTATFNRSFDGGDASDTPAGALDGGDATDLSATVPLEFAEFGFGSDLLFNRVAFTRDGGTVQVVEDATSQARYGIRNLTKSGLLNADDADVLTLAGLRLARVGEPARNVESLTVLLDIMSDAQASVAAAVSVGDLVRVVVSPPGYEGRGPVVSSSRVEQVEHRVSTSSHSIRYRLTSLSDEFGAVVDGGTAATVSFDDTWDGGTAATATFADALDGGDANYK